MATKKAKSGLSRKGILLLADDLVAHKKMYDQDRFGKVSECGAFASLAGMCLWRKLGPRKYRAVAKKWRKPGDGRYDCSRAAKEQIGIGEDAWGGIPDIFSEINYWPEDIQEEYLSNGPTYRVIAALKALQRLRPDGTIDPNPKKIHTRIPQLKTLHGRSW